MDGVKQKSNLVGITLINQLGWQLISQLIDSWTAWDKATKLSSEEKIFFLIIGVLDCIVLLNTCKWDKMQVSAAIVPLNGPKSD